MFLLKQFTLLIFYTFLIAFFGVFIHILNYTEIIFCHNCKEADLIETIFDYIVVGCGSAGAIVAKRLSENKKDKVLLLEAGKHGNIFFDIPSIALLLQQTPFDWQYQTIPQKNSSFGLNNNVSLWPMGKIVGGTGMLNNMIYVRGHSEDFNSWFKDKKGYLYADDVIPYFKKLEQWNNEDKLSGSTYVNNLLFTTKLPEYLLKAAKELGYLITEDTETCKEGFGMPKINIKNGQRWTPAHTLLQQNKPNVILRTSRTVKQILLHNNFEAYGVEYSYKDTEYIAKATKGVILSAGVIGTAKILLHSGIGPKNHLDDVKIKTKIDLPVGDNLQDQLATGFDLILFNKSLGMGLEQMLSPFSFLEYFLFGTGPWTTGGCEVLAHIKTEKNDKPDIQIMAMPVGVNEDRGIYLRHLIGIRDEIWDGYFSKLNDTVTATMLLVLLHPKSRGNLRLSNNKFNSPVLIDPKYLTHQSDIDILVKGIELIKKLTEAEEMKKIGASFNTNVFPPCKKFPFGTKMYWTCYVKYLTVSAYHPVGTCKMGGDNDQTSVVNYNFQVRNSNNLFVIDGSVIPTLTSGNVNGAIFMLAEMASDLIKYKRFMEESRCTDKEIFVKSFKCEYY